MVVGSPVSSEDCLTHALPREPFAPVGTDAFVCRSVSARLDASLHLASACVRACEAEPGLPAAQVAGLALRLSIGPRLTHFLRAHYSVSLLTLASDFDAAFRAVCCELWGVAGPLAPTAALQASLPLRLGGMGFRPLSVVAGPAFLGSWARVLPRVEELLGGSPILGPASPPSPTASAVEDAFAALLAGLNASPPLPELDWEACRSSPSGLPRVQSALTKRLDAVTLDAALASATPEDRARLRCCAGVWASLWLVACPSEHCLSLRDCEYRVAARARLGAPIIAEDPLGARAHASPGRGTRRHNLVRDTLSSALIWMGASALREQVEPALAHIPDIRVSSLRHPLSYLEVHVSHPLRRHPSPSLGDWGERPGAFVDWAWQRRLRVDYRGGPAADAPFQLVPAVASTFGDWHPSFARWLRQVAWAAADASAAGGVGGPSAVCRGVLWRASVSLSVALHRGNFDVLAASAPSLAAGAGALGRPLSEEPEFWRAAPSAALPWATALL